MDAMAMVPVAFQGDTLLAMQTDDGVMVALRPICEALGLNWSGQFLRLKRDAVLSSTVCVMQTVAADGRQREVMCLPLEMVNGWLFTIEDRRVKPAARDKVLAYKRECYRVLYAYFHGRAAAAVAEPLDVADEDDPADLMPARSWTGWLRLIEVTHAVAGRSAARQLLEESPLPKPSGGLGGAGAMPDGSNVHRFVADRVVSAPGESVAAATLYGAYVRWCDGAGEAPVTQAKFGRDMAHRARKGKAHGGVIRYQGIAVSGAAATVGG